MYLLQIIEREINFIKEYKASILDASFLYTQNNDLFVKKVNETIHKLNIMIELHESHQTFINNNPLGSKADVQSSIKFIKSYKKLPLVFFVFFTILLFSLFLTFFIFYSFIYKKYRY